MDPVIIAESEPLLRTASGRQDDIPSQPNSKDVVDFDPNGDAENPLEWPPAFKWSIVALLAAMAFTVTFTCISVVPVANRIVYDLERGEPSKSASVLLVTIWELGEAAGPLLIAPLSEIFGRYPVMNAANVLFIAATALAALSQSTPLFIAARAITGLAVTSNVLSPAIVGDMFASDQRGSPMSLVMLAPLIGGAVGPAISGAVADGVGWRQVMWLSVALATVCETLILTCFRETYKVSILGRRAARLRAETGNTSLRTAFDASDREESLKRVRSSVARPATVLFGSSVLLALSLFGSVVFTFWYIIAVTIPDVLVDIYGLSLASTGSVFISMSIGCLISIIICNLALDRVFIRLRDSHGGIGKPEYRLPLAIFGGFALPFCVAWHGWIIQLHLPLPLLLLSLCLLGMTILLAHIPLMAYVVDAFGLYSASAMTGTIVTRCLMSTFLPLTVSPLVAKLGYGWGFSVLGGVSLCLAPIPVLVMKYGHRWRQWSEYTRDD